MFRVQMVVRGHSGTRAILRALLKDLPPTQLCEGKVSCTVDLGAIGSGASTQQH